MALQIMAGSPNLSVQLNLILLVEEAPEVVEVQAAGVVVYARPCRHVNTLSEHQSGNEMVGKAYPTPKPARMVSMTTLYTQLGASCDGAVEEVECGGAARRWSD